MDFRLIKIEEIEDLTLGSSSLRVALSPVKYVYKNTGYHFDHTEFKEFILLNTKENRDFFLDDPEEIKELHIPHFGLGTLTKPDGTKIDVYRHIDYIRTLQNLRKGIRNLDSYHPLGKLQVDPNIDDENDLPF
ncbi:hypothetical protein [Algoriphagus formosus]|uniref:hypothetical protein n=1 Tax=Algoriphagus formosus TaxID=2007308 RepID=UPI000C28E5F3|nr:hypothetical protein [Algoriphagus formosus]